MEKEKPVLAAFESSGITLALDQIMPIRQVTGPDFAFGKYRSVLASIREMGIIEPPVVYPQKRAKGKYILLDGHLRLHALKELGVSEVFVLVSKDDDAYTYNNKINRLSPIQEQAMILKSIRNGVKAETIARALNVNVEKISSGMNLLDGIHPDAVDLLKDKAITPDALRLLKRVKSLRQVEMAQIMLSTGNYTRAYVDALIIGTPRDMLVKTQDGKSKIKGLSPEEIGRMEKEMESLVREFKLFQDTYGENSLHLNSALRYIRRLLENLRVRRYLQQNHLEIFEELNDVAEMEVL